MILLLRNIAGSEAERNVPKASRTTRSAAAEILGPQPVDLTHLKPAAWRFEGWTRRHRAPKPSNPRPLEVSVSSRASFSG
jgi:hypothetical protein